MEKRHAASVTKEELVEFVLAPPEQHQATVDEFIRDVDTLTQSMVNLYEANKTLMLLGIKVSVEVEAMNSKRYECSFGCNDVIEQLSAQFEKEEQ